MRDVIVYQAGPFSVRPARVGYEVYRDSATHAVRVAVIGYAGAPGIARARAEADRRYAAYLPADQRAECRGQNVDTLA